MNLSSKEATRKGDIPAKILKDSLSAHTKELRTIINNCFKDGMFPNELKLADVSSVFKKDYDLNKENYRPVSILSLCQRFLKESSIDKAIVLWHQSFHLFEGVSGKIITSNTHSWKWLKSGKKILIKEMKLLLFLWIFKKPLTQ